MKFLFFKNSSQKDAKTVGFEFLTGAEKNSHNKYLKDIWGYTDQRLELDHAYIQWIFPLDTPSDHNSLAPVISKSDIDNLASEKLKLIQDNMIHSLSIMLHFYGFCFLKPGEGKLIGRHEYKFSKNKQNWCVMHNHNHLRITRILKSLRLFGLEQYAVAFYQALIRAEEEEKREHANELGWLVNPTTLRFWAEAVGDVRPKEEEIVEQKVF